LPLLKEFHTEAGDVDIIAVDDSGRTYIMETELERNSTRRRTIAQVLDYGASLYSADPDGFIDALDREMRKGVGIDLKSKLEKAFGDVAQMISKMKDRLKEGDLRFLMFMDNIDQRLKDLIRFLNERSSFSMFAVQVELYVHGDLRMVNLRVFGGETKKEVSPRRAPWTE